MFYNSIIANDIECIYNDLKDDLSEIQGTKWLISGGSGFIASYILDLLDYCNEQKFDRPCHIICIDNFITGVPDRIAHLINKENFTFINSNISEPIKIDNDVDYIVHAAGIASPTYYRQYPIDTIMVNVMGLKNLLDIALQKEIKSFLYLSTSEIYGNPSDEFIPTPETYNGNVSCIGPRACYDESKRLGETLCMNYFAQYALPVKVVRPFNIYGPGLRLDDKRVIPDFFYDALKNKKISIFSDGSPTRSFCYISDAIVGLLMCLFSDFNGEPFNIGSDECEISMIELSEVIADIMGDVEIILGKSQDTKYLIDNPQRRYPDIAKAKKLLGYNPKVKLYTGLRRLMTWYDEVYFGGRQG